MSERRDAFKTEIPSAIERLGGVVSLRQIYDEVASTIPDLVDEQPDPPPGHGLKWHHELRWELETLVGQERVLRRKDVGRGRYSLP